MKKILCSEITMSGFTDKSELMRNEGEVAQERVDEPGEDEMRSHVIDAGNITNNKSELVRNEGEVVQEILDEPGEDEMRSHAIDTGNITTINLS